MSASAASPWCDPVPPVADGGPRPRWSVMIPTFRSARFLAATLESVLAQDPGPDAMQVAVVDDASDDDPAAVVAAVGRGRVSFFRQARNVGHIANFHACLTRSRGEIVHLLHGDDQVRPGFYAALDAGFRAAPEAGAAFCRAVYVDEDGRETGAGPAEATTAGLLPDAAARLATEQRIMTPGIAVRRAVYEALGGFDRRLFCSEDWEMWVRIAARYPIWYEPRPLAAYRMHADSNTGRNVRRGRDAAGNRLAISIFTGHLPPDRAGAIAAVARRTYAASALETAEGLWRRGDRIGFLAQVREAMRLSPSVASLRRTLRILSRRGRRHVPTV
jgi:glycosyltransferase involved in cell wall biosynthesis